MKYNDNNKPLVCMQTQSTCYKKTKPIKVLGVLWHSTGANNPNLKRYVQPSDNASDRAKMLAIIGTNKNRNDMNHITRQMGVNAWIGRLANGEVATVQAMPWNYQPWGCGNGNKGSCNDGWIQFEICEDGLNDPQYATRVYAEACELTAYLCKMFDIDPHAMVKFKGVDIPTIIDHRDSALLGFGCNHGDVAHWFPKLIGKTMANVRDDVAAIMGSGESADTPVDTSPQLTLGYRILSEGAKGDDVVELQEKLLKLGYKLPEYGADGDYGAETMAAVLNFQTKNSLEADGVFGPMSLAKLNELLKATETKEETPSAPETFEVTVTGGAVNVRNAPSTATGKVVYIVKKGDVLTAVGTDTATGWYKLTDGNYISNTYTTKS